MKTRVFVGTALAALMVLSACGQSSSDDPAAAGTTQPAAGKGSSSQGAAGLTAVTLSTLSIAQVAPFVVAKEQGIFADHGIDLEIAFVEPAALVPALMSGDSDFIWSNPPALLAARGNKVPLKSVTAVSVAGDDPSTFPIQVMVPPDSDITSLTDLADKTIATASLFQLNDLALMQSLGAAGVDPGSAAFVEIPFPNMAEALTAGRADAVISTEPFVTIMKNSKEAVPLVSVSEGLSETTPISVIASSEQFIGANPEVVANFRAAVDEALEYAVAHEDEVRAVIPTITELSPELAKVIALAPISSTDDAAGWESWAQLLVDVGVLDQAPNAADAFLAD